MEKHDENLKSNKFTRRDFMRSASGAVAVSGGLLMGTKHDLADSVKRPSFQAPWHPTAPKRLSAITHELAARALSGEHGKGMGRADFRLDPASVVGCSLDKRYAYACKLVAERAPIRILPGERIVGSATLLEGAYHSTPVLNCGSTSHTTIGFDRVLKMGYRGLRRQIEARLARGGFEESASDGLMRIESGPSPETLGIRCCFDGQAWAEAVARDEYDVPPLTVECWAKVDSAERFNVLVLNRNKDSANHWELYTQGGTGYFAAYVPGCSPQELVSTRSVADGSWHHLAMRYAPDNLSLYVDGECVASQAITAPSHPDSAFGLVYIGGYPLEGLGCNGVIGDVRVWKGILPVQADLGGMNTSGSALVGFWTPYQGESGVMWQEMSDLRNSAKIVAHHGGRDFLESMLLCLDAATIWHGRYMAALQELAEASTGDTRANYLAVADRLRNVPENPPESFGEAVQSLWFMYAFQRLMGNWSGIGRIDEMLGPYLKRDLDSGRITLDEARELLAHFWIKGCEWIGANPWVGSGDAQFYQNIILAGIDADGNEVTNEVTYLVLDIVEELHISDFPIAVRLNRNTPNRLLRRIAEVQRHGGGIVAVYNEETVIEGLVKFGYPVREARCFTNDGCWEVLIPGKTVFSYVPFDMLAILHRTLGLNEGPGRPKPEFADFESLYAAFLKNLEKQLDDFNRIADGAWKNGAPTPLLSLFVEDCIERARGYYSRGPRYCVLAPHAGGMANVANSLLVLKKLVYDERYITLSEFIDVLRADYADAEAMRRLILNRFVFYGNDDDEADAMMARLFDDYADIAGRVPERNGVLRPAGISTFGREIGWRLDGRTASPDGHHKGEILATNFSPSPGTDFRGPTAVIKSYCKMDFTRVPNGATVELKLHPNSVKDERGLDAMVALLKGFVRLGGFYMHVDVVDSAMLIDAQRHPEKYPNLPVRIAGWSARFATLDKDWQDMVINRTQQYMG